MIKLKPNKKKIITAIDSFIPNTVTIPLKQEEFDNCELQVSIGSFVKEGQVIAQDPNVVKNPLAAAIHSPIPGIVENSDSIILPDGKESKTVKIRLQGSFSYRGKSRSSFNWRSKSPSELIEMIANYGVINTFYINKPSSLAPQVKIRNPDSSKIIIIRLFDDDPFRCTDSFLTENEFEKIRKGAAILAYAIQALGVIFAYDKKTVCPENKEVDAELFKDIPVKYVPIDCDKYPSGFQRVLVERILKTLPRDDFFAKINIYDLLIDSVSLLHLYEAVEEQTPFISQYLYVYGDCLKVSGILRVPLGITLDFLVDECGGFLKQPANIIINGQLTGWKVNEKNHPVTKNIKSVGFISSRSLPVLTPNECIRCGKCREVCPAGLCPDLLYNQIITKSENIDPLFIKASTLCSSCTLCNSVCSARLPLSQVIELIRGHSYEKLFDE